jgi:hypothetical protein
MAVSIGTSPTRGLRKVGSRLAAATPEPETLLALLLYVGLACGVTWPLPIHPGSRVFGPIGADLTGAMAYFHSLAVAHTPPFLPGTVHAFNAPEGRSTQWALNYSTLPSSTLLWLGSTALGSVATLAYWPFSTFTLSALSMFLFVRWLTGSWHAALITGFAFGFWPYVFTGMNQPLGDEWVIVLAVWRMLVLIERPSVRNGVIAAAAVTLALMWVQYYILIVGVTWVLFTLAALVIARTRGQFAAAVRAHAVVVVSVVVVLASILLSGLTSNFEGAPVRSTSEFVMYSARPLMYLLPSPNNPFLGTLSKPIIDREYFSAQSTVSYGGIYLGISVIALAAVGGVILARVIRRRGWRLALADRPVLAAVLLTITALCAFVFSMPPRIGILGVNVPMPIEAVIRVTTVFRGTAKFAVIVMLGLCVLAGLALSKLFSRLRAPAALAVCVVISVVVIVDLWARSPFKITPIIIPPAIQLLAHQAPGIYAEYPIQSGSQFGGNEAFFQAYAGDHDLFNGYFQGTSSESRKVELVPLLAPRTVPELAAMGVRYLLVQRDVEPPPLYPGFEAPIPGAQLIGGDESVWLYRVVARPAQFVSFDTVGFSVPEGPGPQFTRWMSAADGEIEIISRAPQPVPVRVGFSVASFWQPRQLVIRDGERVVYSAVVPNTAEPYRPVPVVFTISVKGKTTLRLHVTPGPESQHAVDPSNPETLPLSVKVSGPLTITPLPTRR